MSKKGESIKGESILKLIDAYGEEYTLSPTPGKSILELAVENSVEIHHSCGFNGSCGTCRVRLRAAKGCIPVRTEVEAEMAADRGFQDDERLSCQVLIPDDEIFWTAEALNRVVQSQ